MIVKKFELNKVNLENFNIFLLYGKNEGLLDETVRSFFLQKFQGEISRYEENEVLSNSENIISEILNKSLFVTKKIILISRSSDKICKIIENISNRDIADIKIILKSGVLEKKSKLRSLFEKNKTLLTIPFYEDDTKSLSSIIYEFLNKKKIKLSSESINLLIERSCGDRKNLNLELEKILNYSLSNKKIEFKNVQKLTTLAENYNVSELADNYLIRNKKNISKILNENSFSDDDCILILRTILNKSKRLLSIIEKKSAYNNIDQVISDFRPAIFWKEKESVKKQVNSWDLRELRQKIYKINEVEYLVKSNSVNSLNLVSDFITSN
ncbi:DNA polymerase III subunit delta [Candidatus Pelagibacter sp.]|nr:DNA polymerase III subunit delta [Candidatus Pelagibacter sp.]